MRNWKTILCCLVFATGCHPWAGHGVAPAAPPAIGGYPAPAATQPTIVQGQPYIPSGGPVFVAPSQPMVPAYGPAAAAVPLPAGAAAPPAGVPPGAVVGPVLPAPPATGAAPVAPFVAPGLGPNPISIPAVDEEVAWDQIVDVVSDYFTVAREQRVRRSGEVWTEGLIQTAPQPGATWLEPHRHDSVGSFNRWESTFQTIRRRAVVRVTPEAAGYLVEVIVEKELEDLPNPERATAGAASFGSVASLPSRRLEPVSRTQSSPLWLSLGRDPLLEQRMLADIQARLGGVAAVPAAAVR